MMSLEEIKNALSDRNIMQVAKNTKIHFNTVYSIANGKNKNPSYCVMETLSTYLQTVSRRCVSVKDHESRCEALSEKKEFADCDKCKEKFCFTFLSEIRSVEEAEYIFYISKGKFPEGYTPITEPPNEF